MPLNAADREPGFRERLDGGFHGILRWPQLDQLWQRVKESGGEWYLYQVGEAVPRAPIGGERLESAIGELDRLLRHDHHYDYCGIVYADDPRDPTLIKVYDPNNLGSSCGCSGVRIPPRWILSRMPPEPIEDHGPTPKGRSRWWQRLFGG
ncbi:MAG TPA: hypothetical protein ENI96_08770 [Sedimenticola thiotaurini]|uniref:Uncharacterized protein n=1 Tax=Sedimenticola thiotaurini TaxID=1543721 RepID=A0A831RJK4_9GAMM|nr:hypothetical protein [Sedimenticola thiotaurini]